MLDRTLAPQSGAIKYPELLEPESLTFPNGGKLFIINAGDQPVVKFEVVINASIWRDPVAGASWFTSKMLTEGSKSKSANEIASIFDFHGAHIDINPSFDNTSISIYCLKKYFEITLKLLFEVMTSPAFPQGELDTLLNIRKQQIKLNNEKNSFVSSKNIRKALFGVQHPYGRSLSQNDLDNINLDVLNNFYENGFFGKPEFFLSGDVGNLEIDLVKSTFGEYSFGQEQESNAAFPISQSDDVSINKPESLQSSIKLGWHIPNKKHSDHFKILVANEILGGYFGSRLMKNLREEKGLTYGISSYPIFMTNASFLIIGADVIADKTQLAIDEVIKEIEILKEVEVDEDELKTVTNYIAGTFLSKISTPFHLMDKFKSVHDHGLDYSYFKKYFETMRSITPQEIRETVNQYFSLSEMSNAVAGKYQ